MPKYAKITLTDFEQYRKGMEDGFTEDGKPYLNTLEGRHIIPENGWIGIGVEGERWAVKDSIFQKTYMKVE